MKKNIILPILLILSVFIFCLSVALKSSINSDSASMYIEAMDMANGNWLLNGWDLSTVPFYFTDTLLYAVIIKIFGPHEIFMWIIPTIIYTLCVFISSLLIYSSKKNYIGLIALLFCVAMPSVYASNFTLAMCIHVGTILLSLTCVYFISKKSRYAPAIIILISPLATFSDKIFLYYFTLPLMVAIVFSLYYGYKKKKECFILLISLFVSVVLYKFISFLSCTYGIITTPWSAPQKFVEYDRFLFNIDLLIKGVIYYFDAFIFGKELGPQSIIYAGRFLSMSIWLSILVVASIKRFRSTVIDTYLVIVTALMPAAYIFSNLPGDLMTTRYFSYSFITGTIIIGRYIQECKVKQIALIGMALFLIVINFQQITLNKPKDDYSRVAKYIASNNLGDGFGTFWEASSTSVRGSKSIYPVLFDNGEFVNMNWLSKDAWYSTKSRYIVIKNDDTEISKVSKEFCSDFSIIRFGDLAVISYKDERISVKR
ncbi:TPA: hypothetical protein ACJFOC_001381 [Escherichia coli]